MIKTSGMAVLGLLALLALAPMGALAQAEPPAPEGAQEDDALSRGAELMRQGMGLLLRGLREELEPMADELAQGWAELVEMLGDFSAYEMPQMLPNGDIIIRRKVPLEPGQGEIDL